MSQTSHLLKDYEGFNNDLEETNESIKTIEDKIKIHEETLRDLSKWKSKEMAKENKKPKEFSEFQGGIILVKDKILHLKKLIAIADSNGQKQHLCDSHLPVIYQLLSQYGNDWNEFYDKKIRNEDDFNTVIDKLSRVTDELMKKFIGKTISIPKFKF